MIAFGVPSHIICFLSLAVYNILCLLWIFAILTKICLDVPGEDTLCFLYPDVYLYLHRLGKFSDIMSSNIFSCPFLSHFTWDLYNVNASMLDTSQWLLLSSFLLFLFFIFSFRDIHYSAFQLTNPFLSVSPNLLLIHSRLYFPISFITLFITMWFFTFSNPMLITSYLSLCSSSLLRSSLTIFQSLPWILYGMYCLSPLCLVETNKIFIWDFMLFLLWTIILCHLILPNLLTYRLLCLLVIFPDSEDSFAEVAPRSSSSSTLVFRTLCSRVAPRWAKNTSAVISCGWSSRCGWPLVCWLLGPACEKAAGHGG